MSYSQYEPPQGPPYGSEPYGGPPLYQPPRPTNGLAIGSMIVSLVAVAGALLCCLPGLIGIAGAVMGHVARGQIRTRGEQGEGFALAGIIIGWAATALSVLVVVVLVVFFAHSVSVVQDPYGGSSL
ncbi:hypothetical protein GCM10028801_43410 [Nocardioides maradonensis]